MRFKRKLFFWVLFYYFFSEKVQTQNQYLLGVFPTIDHTGLLGNRWNYNLYYFGAFPLIDLNAPDVKNDTQFLMLYLEQSASYKMSRNWTMTGSYVYQKSNVGESISQNENRVYIQATYSHNMKSWLLKNRLRWDLRFIQDPFTGEIPVTHRLRYLIGVEKALNKHESTMYFTCYEELFFNTVGGANPVFEENWAYAALGKKLSDKHKVEAGLLYITWITANDSWLNQFYLQLTWISTINWKKPGG